MFSQGSSRSSPVRANQRTGNTGVNGLAQSGSSLADLLLGLPQETTCRPPTRRPIFGRTRWTATRRMTGVPPKASLPLRIALRLLLAVFREERPPCHARHGRRFRIRCDCYPNSVGPFTGKYPRDLIYPEKNNFSPRIGFASHPLKTQSSGAAMGSTTPSASM